jgi:hypothetical protein
MATALREREQGAWERTTSWGARDHGAGIHRGVIRRASRREVANWELHRNPRLHCKSTKQQIVTKSSTEAQLVALCDSASQGLHTRNFITAQGYECGPMTVYQDNMSCMALVERGQTGVERMGHKDIRYFWVKRTKALKGAQFASEKDALTGWS